LLAVLLKQSLSVFPILRSESTPRAGSAIVRLIHVWRHGFVRLETENGRTDGIPSCNPAIGVPVASHFTDSMQQLDVWPTGLVGQRIAPRCAASLRDSELFASAHG
jgi:hypothetical protein